MPNAYTEKLKKKSTGDFIYPVTKSSAVYMPDDTKTLNGEVEDIHSNVATIEDSSTASKAYAVGEFLVYNSQLYKVTAAIASGDTLTVGTNIASTSIGDEITALNSKSEFLFDPPYGSAKTRVRVRANGLVFVYATVDAIPAADTSAQLIPAEYAPTQAIYGVGFDSGNNMRRFALRGDGSITAYQGTATGLYFFATYLRN